MSIVHSAPGGWEFQYAATAMIGLVHLPETGATLLVEPEKGEDAELTLEIKFGKFIVEIQAKSSREDLDSSVLAGHLTHFPDRLATNNLLARLMQDQSRIALFIVGGRCTDSTRGFISKAGEIKPHPTSPLKQSLLKALIAEIEKFYHSKNPSGLASDRDKFCRNLAANLSVDLNKSDEIAQRIVVWEQLQKHDLELRIEDVLSRTYSVPRTQASNARLVSVETVRLARDKQVNLIPVLKNVLVDFAGINLLPEPYLPRGCEDALIAELKQYRVLFLTGQSKCGKSMTARFIAEEFRKMGVSCEVGSSTPDAIRYLHFVGQDDRLFLLDDPFGHLTQSATAAEDLSRIKNLIESLPAHRYLIVTSRVDIVAVAGAQNPFPSVSWHDLTVKESAFLTNFWKTACSGKGLPDVAFNTVLQNLGSMNESALLQPGQLRYLARIPNPASESNFSELCRLAQYNSGELANSFIAKGAASQQLHAALALCATVLEALPIECLGYILSADSSRPGIHIKDSLIRLGQNSPPPPFPSHRQVPSLGSDLKDELVTLEQRGILRISKSQIIFSHPDYFEASTLVLLRVPSIRFGEFLSIATRAVTGLFPAIAKNALRQLLRMFKSCSDVDQQKEIIELAFLAFNSIFPSVRDLSLTILVSWLELLTKDDQERVFDQIRITDLQYDDILWHDGIPWLNPTPRMSFERLFGKNLVSSDEAKQADLITRLLDATAKSPLSVREAWILASNLRQRPKTEISYAILKALMRYDEGFIRADAAFLLCTNLTRYDEEAVKLALEDDHPAVAFEGVLGCFASWHSFSDELKSALRQNIQRVFGRIDVVAFSNRFVIDFGDAERMGSFKWRHAHQDKTSEQWLLWADIVQVFLRTLVKHSVRINESNLWNTTKEARPHLTPELGLAICQAWFEWIEARLKHTLPDDYGLALAEFLIEVTEEKPAIRSEMSAFLLNHGDTSFLLSNVKEYISHWSDLTEAERSMVLALFKSDRPDSRWIRSLALTRANTPSQVVEGVVGVKSLSNLSAREVIDLLPAELLQDCLYVYTGRHPILYYLGFSLSAHNPWLQILEYSVERPRSANFELGLREMLSASLNGSTKWPNAYRIWANLCVAADKVLRERLFHSLLTWTIRINGNESAIFWRVFLNKVKDSNELDDYLCRIIDVIEAVENSTDYVYDAFGCARFSEKMLPKLPSDSFALTTLDIARQTDDHTFRLGILDLLKAQYEKAPPRLRRVHELVAGYVGKDNSELESLVEERRREGINKSWPQYEEFDEVPVDLPGWNSWREEDLE